MDGFKVKKNINKIVIIYQQLYKMRIIKKLC